jgi:hypothetical protein
VKSGPDFAACSMSVGSIYAVGGAFRGLGSQDWVESAKAGLGWRDSKQVGSPCWARPTDPAAELDCQSPRIVDCAVDKAGSDSIRAVRARCRPETMLQNGRGFPSSSAKAPVAPTVHGCVTDEGIMADADDAWSVCTSCIIHHTQVDAGGD